jgi:hypothetical protein
MNHELTPEDAALISSETSKKVMREAGHKGIETATVVGMSQSKGNVPYVIISVAAGGPGGTVLTVPSKTGQMFYPGQRVSIEWDPPAGCYVTGSIDLQPIPRVRASLLCGSGSWNLSTYDPLSEDNPTLSPGGSGSTEAFTLTSDAQIELFTILDAVASTPNPNLKLLVNDEVVHTLAADDAPIGLNLDVAAGSTIRFESASPPDGRVGGEVTITGFRTDAQVAWILE